jgi:hypothetical protein
MNEVDYNTTTSKYSITAFANNCLLASVAIATAAASSAASICKLIFFPTRTSCIPDKPKLCNPPKTAFP